MKGFLRRTIVLGALVVLVLAVTSGQRLSAQGEDAQVTVTVRGLSYSPAEITVETGTAVIWRNEEPVDYPVLDGTHRVRAADGSFDSGPLQPGQQSVRRFLLPGTFAYACTVHPDIMGGTVTVTGEPITEVKDIEVSIQEPAANDTETWGFDPKDLTVTAGATVTWRNNGAQTHTVTADDGSFSSPEMAPGATFKRTFSKSVSLRYKCTPHPWMQGTLRVAAVGGALPPPPPVRRSSNAPAPPPPVQPRRASADEPVTQQVYIVEPSVTVPQGWGFSPSIVRGRAGDSIVWTNTGTAAHSVTADDGSFDSGNIAPGGTFRRALNAVKTITYHCTPHPWMKGSVVVSAASAPRVRQPSVPTPPSTGSAQGNGNGSVQGADGERAGDIVAIAPGDASLALAAIAFLLAMNVAIAIPWAGELRRRSTPMSSGAEVTTAVGVVPAHAPDDERDARTERALVGARS